MSNVLVKAEGIKKDFSILSPNGQETIHVLKGIDLEIEAGKSTSIVGRSGAGKSTLVHILGTLETPSEGKVFLEGKEINFSNPGFLDTVRKDAISFIFQFHHLIQELTAIENVALREMIRGENKNRALKEAKTSLEEVGLGSRLYHRPSEMSGGEQQRVCIARAIISKPKIIFADEPTGNLDSRTGKEVEDILMKLMQDHGISLCLVTHNKNLAERCDLKVSLEDGVRVH